MWFGTPVARWRRDDWGMRAQLAGKTGVWQAFPVFPAHRPTGFRCFSGTLARSMDVWSLQRGEDDGVAGRRNTAGIGSHKEVTC